LFSRKTQLQHGVSNQLHMSSPVAEAARGSNGSEMMGVGSGSPGELGSAVWESGDSPCHFEVCWIEKRGVRVVSVQLSVVVVYEDAWSRGRRRSRSSPSVWRAWHGKTSG
jgi:hypothetical protein